MSTLMARVAWSGPQPSIPGEHGSDGAARMAKEPKPPSRHTPDMTHPTVINTRWRGASR
jgi:hypothetical protein